MRRCSRGHLRAFALAAVLAVAGCSGSDNEKRATSTKREAPAAPATDGTGAESDPGRWATQPELAWLRRFGAWNRNFNAALVKIQTFGADPENQASVERGDEAAVSELERLLAPLRECAERFEARVGDPPTERLAAGAELITTACDHYRSAAEKALEGAKDMNAAALEEARSQTERAVELTARVNEILPPGEAQVVPKLGKKTRRSRIDPLYSRVAEGIAGKEAEVRCWSDRDWRKLIREERAYAGRRLPADLFGITGYLSRRVNLSPVVCANLDRFTYDKWRPRDEERMLLLAYSVVTLAHEVQHSRGVIEEARADCYGMQHAEEVALGLGAGAKYAAELAETYWDDHENLPRLYASRQCRPGGKLDLDPGDSRWP